jgi:hypothetical protein
MNLLLLISGRNLFVDDRVCVFHSWQPETPTVRPFSVFALEITGCEVGVEKPGNFLRD